MKRIALLLFLTACSDRKAPPDFERQLDSTPAGFAPVGRLAVSESYGCAVSKDGQLACWGAVPARYIGISEDAVIEYSAKTVSAPGRVRFVAVAAGLLHTCAADTGGGVWCWGRGRNGELGNEVANNSSAIPRQVRGLGRVVGIVAGRSHTCAIDFDGIVWCWGANAVGQLGTGLDGDASVPVRVATEQRFTRLAASPNGTCGLSDRGLLFCWGDLSYLGDAAGRARTPTPINLPAPLRAVDVGDAHACGIGENGSIVCWGVNRYGALGVGASSAVNAVVDSPTAVSMSELATRVAAGGITSCAVGASGKVYCWGFTGRESLLGVPADTLCQLRAPGSGCVLTPREVRTPLRFQDVVIGLGEEWRCGITVDDRIACWGRMSIDVNEPPKSEPTIIPWPPNL